MQTLSNDIVMNTWEEHWNYMQSDLNMPIFNFSLNILVRKTINWNLQWYILQEPILCAKNWTNVKRQQIECPTKPKYHECLAYDQHMHERLSVVGLWSVYLLTWKLYSNVLFTLNSIFNKEFVLDLLNLTSLLASLLLHKGKPHVDPFVSSPKLKSVRFFRSYLCGKSLECNKWG